MSTAFKKHTEVSDTRDSFRLAGFQAVQPALNCNPIESVDQCWLTRTLVVLPAGCLFDLFENRSWYLQLLFIHKYTSTDLVLVPYDMLSKLKYLLCQANV